MIAFWVSALGLLAGAGMGFYGLINPKWASRLVRLRDDPEMPGGFAEFRATYGGLFFASHALALFLLLEAALDSERLRVPPILQAGWGGIGVCGAMWIGTGIGRFISMLRDGSDTRFNQGSVVFELALGLAILSPWAVSW